MCEDKEKEEYMGETILIVESDPMTLKLFQSLLQINGYETLEATDGRRGVELAKEKKPDLILMDVQVSSMDGLNAMTILKEDETMRHTPIVAVTAHAMKGDEEKLRSAGCDGYMTKPIDTREFLKKVTEYLSG
jgi:two-component system cell cycle response regulator DivK